MEDKRTILIADDTRMYVRYLTKHLEPEGYAFIYASTGPDTLEKAEKHIPDVILLDVMMPGMTGFEVCQRLKNNDGTKHIPVIFLTAMTDTVDKVKGLELGAVDYIDKPFVPAEVVARVRTQIRMKSLHEENLEQQRVLLEAQRLSGLGRMASGIAHNFYNLLSTVTGYAELANLLAQEEKLSQYMAQILRACERMQEITHQFVNFARWNEQEPMSIKTTALINEVMDLFAAGSEQKPEIHLEVPTDLPALWVDPWLTSQALLNIMINAREAMPDGGTIQVLADEANLPPGHLVRKNSPKNGKCVRLQVKDKGVGMSDEVLASSFEPFVSTKQTVGVGVGLWAAHQFINSQGGAIDVESIEGQGTTFHVYLPAVT